MALLDIEKAINSERIRSRFRLVNMAGQRAREINTPKENTVPMQVTSYKKITTNALAEITSGKIIAVPIAKETAAGAED